eukprot:266541_1
MHDNLFGDSLLRNDSRFLASCCGSTSSWHSNPFLLATNDAMCLNDFASALFGGQTMNDLTVPLIQMPYIFYLRKFIIDLKRWIIRISLSYFLHICVYFDPNYGGTHFISRNKD